MVKSSKAISDIAKQAGAQTSEQEQADREEISKLQRQQHIRRLLGVIQNGYTVTGVRMSDPKTGHENGVVVTFYEEEQKKIVAAIGEILKARS